MKQILSKKIFLVPNCLKKIVIKFRTFVVENSILVKKNAIFTKMFPTPDLYILVTTKVFMVG